MRKGREPEPQLVGSHPMGTGPIGKQIHLLLFDPVFHIPAGAVKVLVKCGSKRAAWAALPQPSLGRLVTIKRGLSPLGNISALPITRHALVQLLRVEYPNSV